MNLLDDDIDTDEMWFKHIENFYKEKGLSEKFDDTDFLVDRLKQCHAYIDKCDNGWTGEDVEVKKEFEEAIEFMRKFLYKSKQMEIKYLTKTYL